MSEYVFKLPDLGEGTVEAEIVAWHVRQGDEVSEDAALVEVMTDKASVEVPSPVSGRIVAAHGAPGERIAVGATLAVFDTATAGKAAAQGSSTSTSKAAETSPSQARADSQAPAPPQAVNAAQAASSAPAASDRGARVMASPATRRQAREAGIDLASVQGSGPNGRILREDLTARANTPPTAAARRDADTASANGAGAARADAPKAGVAQAAATTEVKVIGLRRVIAERMSESKRSIPHFAYVEEVDLTELESLRQALNSRSTAGLTYLPFIAKALIRALEEFPQCNARYDAERGVVVQHHAVHLGIATQTPDGLKVPVVRDAQDASLRQLSDRIKSAADAARTNRSARSDLSGSTITLTSLGKLGGIASTPIINAPEVAIVGLNRALERPMIHRGIVAARLMMNISSSFDHRFVDGHDAAAMIQAVKFHLEHPATLFISKADL